MNLLLNILWLIFFGGFISAFLWFFVGVVLAITIIGLPWARSCFVIAKLTLWPFGKEIAKSTHRHHFIIRFFFLMKETQVVEMVVL